MRCLTFLCLTLLWIPLRLVAQDPTPLRPGDTIRLHDATLVGPAGAVRPPSGTPLVGRFGGMRGDTLLVIGELEASTTRALLTSRSRLEHRVRGHAGGRFARVGAMLGAGAGILAATATHEDKPDYRCTGDLITTPLRCHETNEDERPLLVEMLVGGVVGATVGAGAGWLTGRFVSIPTWRELGPGRAGLSGSVGATGDARIRAQIRF